MDEIHTLYSNQEETDSRVILYLHHAVKMGYKSAVVRTPDTDIFFIILHHCHAINLTIYLDTGTGKHRRLINVTTFAETLGSIVLRCWDTMCTLVRIAQVHSGEKGKLHH